jgi:RNA polymerase sigma factor (sigma-70 family)
MTEKQIMQKNLAVRAQQGDQQAQLQLWESVERLLFKLCARCFYGLEEQAKNAGAAFEDFQQLAWFAFLDAVKRYEPTKGFAFTSYLNYALKTHISSLLGIRSSRRDALNYCDSLNRPMDGEDPDGPELLDMVADEADPYESAAERVYYEQLHAAIEKYMDSLPLREREVIDLLYLKGETLDRAGAQIGVSRERTRQIRNKALRKGRDGYRRRFFEGFAEVRDNCREQNAYRHTGLSSFHSRGASSVELTAERMERLEKKWRARFGDLRWSPDQSGSRQDCEAYSGNSPLQFNGCSQIGTGEGSLK